MIEVHYVGQGSAALDRSTGPREKELAEKGQNQGKRHRSTYRKMRSS